jgi:hypothetical protein
MPSSDLVEALAKVVIAAAWADGDLSSEEIEIYLETRPLSQPKWPCLKLLPTWTRFDSRVNSYI